MNLLYVKLEVQASDDIALNQSNSCRKDMWSDEQEIWIYKYNF